MNKVKQGVFVAIILIICDSCSGFKDLSSSKTQEYTFVKTQPDTVVLDESERLISAVTRGKVYGNQLSFVELDTRTAYLFTTEGRLIRHYHRDNVKGYKLPDLPASQAFFDGENMHLLFIGSRRVFICDTLGNFLRKIDLEVPDITEPSTELFHYDKKKNIYIIGSETTSANNGKVFYEESKFISIYNSEGKLLRSFGTAPEDYTSENQMFMKRYCASYADGKIYLLFPKSLYVNVFEPSGKELDPIPIFSGKFNGSENLDILNADDFDYMSKTLLRSPSQFYHLDAGKNVLCTYLYSMGITKAFLNLSTIRKNTILYQDIPLENTRAYLVESYTNNYVFTVFPYQNEETGEEGWKLLKWKID